MIAYKQPKVQLLPLPVGIDFEIQKLQLKLSEIQWLEVAFGRCSKQVETRQKGENKKPLSIVYPEVYYNQEPYNCMVNDNLKSYCFFNALDPLTIPNFEPGDLELVVTQPLDLIFWLNLQKINESKKYNFTEQLRHDILSKLQGTKFVISESFVEYNEVFKPFTITETFKNYTKYPYSAIKFSGEFSFDYMKNCYDGQGEYRPPVIIPAGNSLPFKLA